MLPTTEEWIVCHKYLAADKLGMTYKNSKDFLY